MENYFVYILQSLPFKNKFYIGVTKNLNNRLEKHNNGSSKSTKAYKPWKVIYFEVYQNKQEAYKREFYLKNLKGYREKKEIFNKFKIKERWQSG